MKVKLEGSIRHNHHPQQQQQEQILQRPVPLLAQETNNQFITPPLAKQHTFSYNHNHHQQTLLGEMGAAVPPVHSEHHQRRDSVSLSDYYSDNEPNDNLDFNELTRIAQYRQAIEIIKRKCGTLSKDNEKLVGRLHHVKKITKHKEKDVLLLKTRLDQYNDGWRTAQPDNQAKEEQRSLIPQTNKIMKKTKTGKKEKLLAAGSGGNNCIAGGNVDPTSLSTLQNQQRINSTIITTVIASSASSITPFGITTPSTTKKSLKVSQQQQSLLLPLQKSPTSTAQKRKRVKTEREKDPNAPKRPANAFFQFCQEKRSNLMDELNSELKPGEPELSKQELTRQLANRWRSMDSDSKKVYVNKYENSKQKYNEEMQCYRENVNSVGTNEKTMPTSLELDGLVPSLDTDSKRRSGD